MAATSTGTSDVFARVEFTGKVKEYNEGERISFNLGIFGLERRVVIEWLRTDGESSLEYGTSVMNAEWQYCITDTVPGTAP